SRCRKERKSGQLKLHLAIDFDQRAIACSNDSPRDGRSWKRLALTGRRLDNLHTEGLKLNGLALILFEHPLLIDDCGVVVLLGHLDDVASGRIAENDGVRLKLAGDV